MICCGSLVEDGELLQVCIPGKDFPIFLLTSYFWASSSPKTGRVSYLAFLHSPLIIFLFHVEFGVVQVLTFFYSPIL